MSLLFAFLLLAVACLVTLATAVAMALAIIGGLMTGVPFIAAPGRVQKALAELCPLDDTSIFYDLGCGDGRFVAGMAQRFPSAACVGVEKAPLPTIMLWLRMRFFPLPNMRVLYKDFDSIDLSNATHIYLYLFPALMDRLEPKLIKELKPGTRVVSCDFVFSHLTPSIIVPLGSGPHPHRLQVYDF